MVDNEMFCLLRKNNLSAQIYDIEVFSDNPNSNNEK